MARRKRRIRGIGRLFILTFSVNFTNLRAPPNLPERLVPMSRRIAWTDAQDAQIRRRRGEGATWEVIAIELSLALSAVTERGRRIGAGRPDAEFVPAPEDPLRDPLPAGHPTSWDAINKGTTLEGEPYPLRFFHR
jgi:hypothetical protein